ncbi:MAG: hypothetical protein M1334_04030 [Patescibacteria group bacterium]|nr:hypothetical protein [Patescibacteria group bacterium]
MDKNKLRNLILSWSIAFVVIWFGVNEIHSPQDWVVYAPSFLGTGRLADNLVLFHGLLLCVSGAALVFNFYRRMAALIIFLMILEISATFIFQTGVSDVVVRDIGVAGAALSLVF